MTSLPYMCLFLTAEVKAKELEVEEIAEEVEKCNKVKKMKKKMKELEILQFELAALKKEEEAIQVLATRLHELLDEQLDPKNSFMFGDDDETVGSGLSVITDYR